MKKFYFLLFFISMSGFAQNVTITKVIETACPTPFVKSVELYVDGTVDFSTDVVVNYMNNGGAWNGTLIDVTSLGSVTDSFVYIVRDMALMQAEFPSMTFDASNTVVTSTATNGDDGYQILLKGNVVSQFGKTATDADNDTDTDWNHGDAVATRKTGIPDLGAWDRSHWDITAENALDSETSCASGGTNSLEAYFATLGSTYSLGSGSGWTPTGPICTTVLLETSTTCVAKTAGATDDTYSVSVNFSGGNMGKTFVVTATSGTVGGDDPTSVATGTITISGVVEGTDVTLTVKNTADGGVCDLSSDIKSPGCVPLVLNEVLFDPAGDLTGDANGDGTRSSSEDEFIELINHSDSDLDISGFKVYDNSSLRHTFPASTIIPANGVLVVFGGGTPTGTFGGAIVQTASSGTLNLNNSSDVILIENTAGGIALEYKSSSTGIAHDDNQSVTRSPDITGNFVLHSTANASLLFSPGLKVDGSVLSIEKNNFNKIGLFPNPVSKTNSYLTINSNSSEQISITIFSVLGREIEKQKVTNNQINISKLKAGIYLMKISQGKSNVTKKIIIQ